MDVSIGKFDALNLRIDTDSTEYLDIMRTEFTRRVPNFQFTPKFKARVWDGKICMINKWRYTFPYGILMDFIRVHKRNYQRIPIIIQPEVKALFYGPNLKIKYDLTTHKVRVYQYDRERLIQWSAMMIPLSMSGISLGGIRSQKNLLASSTASTCSSRAVMTDGCTVVRLYGRR